ncbi:MULTISPECIES: sugar nucleotide-binding protein [Pseudoalteromonas]|uniref:SDR family oxidoreductase n=1 Tax=Pseudoalteromonas TaxID=53246 RepID=UPI000F7B3762|nr:MULTISPECIES: sugar nucleotide-binding protein [Pseudoalteromonas]MCG7563605.1 sugar nucleotide-binding protein [Pseudoalteromonas sp. McH1-42]
MAEDQQLTPIIFGASGLLGSHLYRHFVATRPNSIGTYAHNPQPGMQQFRLQDNTLADLTLDTSCQYIAIICASLTNIGAINAAPEKAAQVNVEATLALIKELHQQQIPIIFVSTDNVFTGDTGYYSDDSLAPAVSEYGKQKRHVENALMSLTDGQACVIRLAKIIGNPGADGTILNDIAGQISSGDPVRAATDLIFNPTDIMDIVSAFNLLVEQNAKGFYNFCNPQSYSRYDLAEMMANALQSDTVLCPIRFAELDPNAKRPLNTTMVNSTLFSEFDFTSVHTCIASGIAQWKK